jgi:hypothetical protein
LKDCGFSEERFFIHCDGALFGMMMPFLRTAPMVSFRKPIGSVSVSGHKFVGAPVPCGVVITRFRHVLALSSDVEYLNSRDATIMGSRNGHAPIYLWYTLTRKGYDGMRADVERCVQVLGELVTQQYTSKEPAIEYGRGCNDYVSASLVQDLVSGRKQAWVTTISTTPAPCADASDVFCAIQALRVMTVFI